MKETENKKSKAFPYTLTVVGYLLIIIFLFMVAPVVCPPIFGYHTYTVNSDSTGLISAKGSVVYAKAVDCTSFVNGNLIAIDNSDGDRDVDCYYVDANDVSSQTITLRGGDTVSYDLVKGNIRAKTPFIGYLCGVVFTVGGVIVSIVLLAAGIVITTIANKIRKKQKEEEQEQASQEA